MQTNSGAPKNQTITPDKAGILLNGGANFYGTNIEELREEGKISLKTFLTICKEKSLNSHKEYLSLRSTRMNPNHPLRVVTRYRRVPGRRAADARAGKGIC